MALKIDAKFEGKLTYIFQNDMRNSEFYLKSKMAELNLNKNSKQLDRPDAVRKLSFTLKINE